MSYWLHQVLVTYVIFSILTFPYTGEPYGHMDLKLYVHSLPITTKVVSSIPVHGEVYWIQHYVIQLVSDLRQVGGFLQVFRFHPLIKLTATI